MNNSKYIFDNLKKEYPTYHTFLNYSKDYEFLFAVILSAQTTDKKVNDATSILFKDLPSLDDYSLKNKEIIINDIKSLGLYKAKCNYLIDSASILINKYNRKIPSSREELILLPGVGKKTSGVVLNELYHANLFPVDTHIERVSKRLGLVKETDIPDIIEDKLESYFDMYDKVYLHHAFILLGRNVCSSSNPKCHLCPLKKVCKKGVSSV